MNNTLNQVQVVIEPLIALGLVDPSADPLANLRRDSVPDEAEYWDLQAERAINSILRGAQSLLTAVNARNQLAPV